MTHRDAFETAPATLSQLFLVERCGAKLYREGVGGCYTLAGDFTWADENDAEIWAASFGPELGPEVAPLVEMPVENR